MAKPKLMYFDAPVSRGEECRLALHIAGVEFDDVRVKPADWPSVKPTTPYGSMPVFEVPGHPPLAHSNAILALIGRQHGLHPKDNFEAARHEGMMAFVEELRHHVSPTLRMSGEEKQKAREALAATYLPQWGAIVEKNLGDGPFFAGKQLNVVDLKLHMAVKWFIGGKVDFIPATIFDGFPKLMRVYEAVRDDERVKSWYAKT
jgi:glutathione S-transferase